MNINGLCQPISNSLKSCIALLSKAVFANPAGNKKSLTQLNSATRPTPVKLLFSILPELVLDESVTQWPLCLVG